MNDGKRDWRVWAAIFSLIGVICFAILLTPVIKDVEEQAFYAQWAEKVRTVDTMLNQTDTFVLLDDDWNSYDYIRDLSILATDLDSWEGVFAALYDADINILSERIVSPPVIDPVIEGYADVFKHNERGERIIHNGPSDWAQMYFRWVPTDRTSDHRLLMVLAMRPSAMLSHPSEKLITWCIGSLLLTGIMLAASVIALLSMRRREREYGTE